MIIDQLPLLGGDVQGTDEFPIERGTTTYKTTQAALIKPATDAAAAAQAAADDAQLAADNAQDTADEANAKGLPSGGTAGQVLTKADSSDYSAAWQNPSGGGDVTADMLGIVIDGNSTPVGASVGQYVIVKDSTITGITDGLYAAAQAIPANTAIDATYLTAVSGGGLNSVRSLRKLLWINPSPNSAFNAQTVNLSESASNFDKIEVVFLVNNTVSTPLTEIVQFEPGYRMHGFYFAATGSPEEAYFWVRQITQPVTGTTVSFANVFHAPNLGTVSQKTLVPWKIYGIKY